MKLKNFSSRMARHNLHGVTVPTFFLIICSPCIALHYVKLIAFVRKQFSANYLKVYFWLSTVRLIMSMNWGKKHPKSCLLYKLEIIDVNCWGLTLVIFHVIRYYWCILSAFFIVSEVIQVY